jgi:hypothetical protein
MLPSGWSWFIRKGRIPMKRPSCRSLFLVGVLLVAARVAPAETLTFFNNGAWNAVGNWYVKSGNAFVLAGRIPASADDAVLGAGAVCDASAANPQLVSLTIRLTATLNGGNFDVGTLNFVVNDAPGSGSAIGVNNARFNIRSSGSINFDVANVGINNSEIIMQGGSFANVAAGGSPSFTSTTIFNQGSFVLQPGTGLFFLGGASRFDNIGDIRGNGGTTQIAAGLRNLTLNNSGTIRADSGTLVINGNLIWTADDGDGSFYPFTSDAVIKITGAFFVPPNTTTYFKGPGTVAPQGSITIDGTLEVGVPASGPITKARSLNAENTPAEPGNLVLEGNAVIGGGGVVNIESESNVDEKTSLTSDVFPGIKITVKKGGSLKIKGPNNNGKDAVGATGGQLLNYGAVIFNVRQFEARDFIFINQTDGIVDCEAPVGFVSTGSPAPVFTNSGTWNAKGGTSSNPLVGFSGNATNAPFFNNYGAFSLTNGPFQITGGETEGGTFQTDATSEIRFIRSRFRVRYAKFTGNFGLYQEGELSIGKPLPPEEDLDLGTFGFHGGTLSLGANVVSRAFSWEGGTISGPAALRVPADGTLNILGANPKNLIGAAIDNSGAAIWSGSGNIELREGANWTNRSSGTFDIQTDAALPGSEQETFNNLAGALFKKSAGAGTTHIGPKFNNNGMVSTFTGTLAFCNFLQSSGAVHLLGGKFSTYCGTPLVVDGGTCDGDGTIDADLVIGTNVEAPQFGWGPGNSPGKITVNGNFTQGSRATLEIEVAGVITPGGDYDLLAVRGTATLGGTLHVTAINGFKPAGTDTIMPVTASSIIGNFGSTNAQVNYGPESITVAALASKLPQLLNISTRLRVLTGENVLIGGFIITGTDPKKLIIRGIGPSLSGVGGTLPDPTLEVHQGAATIAKNDNWKTNADGSSQQAEVEATTIPPANELESAIVMTLNPGTYTAILADKDGASGVGVVEVYDLEQAANSTLANISSRGFVGTGDNVIIGGLIVGGDTGVTGPVIVRAIGPSLSAAGIQGPLQDPTLELHDGSGTTIATNDNWKVNESGGSQQAEIQATTVPPSDDREAALVRSLAAGNYTVIVRGKSNTTGVGVVEAYKLQ